VSSVSVILVSESSSGAEAQVRQTDDVAVRQQVTVHCILLALLAVRRQLDHVVAQTTALHPSQRHTAVNNSNNNNNPCLLVADIHAAITINRTSHQQAVTPDSSEYITNYTEIKYNTQISTGNSWVSHNAVTQLIQTEATNESIPENRIKL